MDRKAQSYLAVIATGGLALIAAAGWSWSAANLQLFAAYLALTLAGSMLKLRLPGMTGTMSLNFLFALIGVAEFSFSEAVIAASAGALLQSLWKAKQAPRPAQVLFNISAIAISTAIAHDGARLAMQLTGATSTAVLLALATALFLFTNVSCVAVMVALAEHHRIGEVWRRCYLQAFPYFAFGAALGALACSTHQSSGWVTSLLILPAIVLMHLHYRLHLAGMAPDRPTASGAGPEGMRALLNTNRMIPAGSVMSGHLDGNSPGESPRS